MSTGERLDSSVLTVECMSHGGYGTGTQSRALRSSPPVGTTMAAARGMRTVYNFTGQRGLDQLSVGARFTSGNPHGFRGRLVSIPLGDIAYEDLSLTDLDCQRATIGDGGAVQDVMRLTHVLEGTIRLEYGDGEVQISADQWLPLITRRAHRMRAAGSARVETVVIPVRRLQRRAEVLEAVAFTVLPASAIGTIFGGLLRALSTTAPDDNTAEAELLTHAILDLSRAMIDLSGEDGSSVDRDEILRRQAHSIIERHYTDPALHVSGIAARLGVSTRHLHRLFASEPLSIAQCIRHWRVTATARDLLVTNDSFEVIAARAGFGSVDTAYRSFRDQQGMSPAEYRRRSQL